MTIRDYASVLAALSTEAGVTRRELFERVRLANLTADRREKIIDRLS